MIEKHNESHLLYTLGLLLYIYNNTLAPRNYLNDHAIKTMSPRPSPEADGMEKANDPTSAMGPYMF